MTWLFYVLLLLPPAAVVWIVWSYWRKAADKEAASRERAALLVAAKPQSPVDRVYRRSADPPATPAPAERTPRPAPVPAAAGLPRERFLSPAETLTYYLLKAGLPGHEVFPRVSLASVLTLAAKAAEAPPGADPRLARHVLDFVVCDKSLQVIAVVSLIDERLARGAQWLEGHLAAAGIRLVHIDPKAPPKRGELKAFVTGRDD